MQQLKWTEVAQEMYHWLSDQPEEEPTPVSDFHEITWNMYAFDDEESEELLQLILHTRDIYTWKDKDGNKYLSCFNPIYQPWYAEYEGILTHEEIFGRDDPSDESSSEEECSDGGVQEQTEEEDEEGQREKQDKQRRRDDGEQVSSDEEHNCQQLSAQFSGL